jgi:hypothetical protein
MRGSGARKSPAIRTASFPADGSLTKGAGYDAIAASVDGPEALAERLSERVS